MSELALGLIRGGLIVWALGAAFVLAGDARETRPGYRLPHPFALAFGWPLLVLGLGVAAVVCLVALAWVSLLGERGARP